MKEECMTIVIDEWIVHFIEEQNKNKEAFDFLQKVYEKCDKLVTIEGGPLMKKIYGVMKGASNWRNTAQVQLAKYFIQNFVKNSDKFILLNENELDDVPDEIQRQIPSKDLYLVQAHINTPNSVILTTDGRLKERVEANSRIGVALVEDFLDSYDC